jgi:hypothetical protein
VTPADVGGTPARRPLAGRCRRCRLAFGRWVEAACNAARSATFLQPDGDSAFVRVTYYGTTHSGGVSKDQILAILTDPTLDK